MEISPPDHDSLYEYLDDVFIRPSDPEVRLKIAAAMPRLLGIFSSGAPKEALAELLKQEAQQIGCALLELGYAVQISTRDFNKGQKFPQ